MDFERISAQREYIWKYFALHSEQRLKTFHFFVILSTVVSGATAAVIKGSTDVSFSSPLLFLLAFLAFVFWKLDRRNYELIQHAESVLKALEYANLTEGDSDVGQFLFVSEQEKKDAHSNNRNGSLANVSFSYSDCFTLVFFVFGVCGFVLGVLVIFM